MIETMTELASLDYFNSEIKEKMNAFSSTFDQKITKGKNELITNKDKYVNLINELSQQQNDLLNQLENLNKRSVDIEKQSNEEVQELENAKLKNDELVEQTEQYENLKQDLTVKIQELNSQITTKRQELTNLNAKLKENKKLNILELNKFEQYLGLKIEGLKPDLLKFNFSHIDLNNYDKIASFKLDLSGSGYKVLDTEPKLKDEDVVRIENDFNEHRDLAKFLKEIRIDLSKL